MAEHIWTLLCHKFLVDPETNVISIIDVAEQLLLHPVSESETLEQTLEKAYAAGNNGIFFPVHLLFLSHWIRSQWEIPEEMVKIRISLIDPQGEKLQEQEQTIKLLDFTSARLALNVSTLRVTTLGYYFFAVEYESSGQWERVARVPLEIRAAAN